MSKHLEEAPEQTSRLDALMKTSRFAFPNYPPAAGGAGSCASRAAAAALQSAGEHLLSFNTHSGSSSSGAYCELPNIEHKVIPWPGAKAEPSPEVRGTAAGPAV